MFPSYMKGLLAAGTALATVCGAGVAAAADMVALLLPENVNPRWEQQDAAAFVSTMKEIAPDVSVEVFNANNDTSVQQRQAEQALTQGAKVLVVIPIDGESSAVIADLAAEEGIPTIAYDRMINSMNTTFWVQADLEGMGFDQASHVSIHTGLELGGGTVRRFRHRDLDHLEQQLGRHRADHEGAIVISDGVFSVDGVIAPIDGLVAACRGHDSRLFIDDAHGVGVVGDGRGVAAVPGVDLLGGTLSKAFGSLGGFLAGDAATLDYIRVFGRATCSTSNLSVANVAAARAALAIIIREPQRRARLETNTLVLRDRLAAGGVATADSPAPVLGIDCGSDATTFDRWRDLYARGVATHALPYPIAPLGHSTIRLRITAATGGVAHDRIATALLETFGDDRGAPPNTTN